MPLRFLILISAVLVHGAPPPIKLPEHTPYPEVQDENALKNLVIDLGLIYKSYTVVTEDGYKLNLNRVMNPGLTRKKKLGPPVLMVNGLMMHSEAWLIQSNPHHSVAIALLEAGYDIWMGDQRGTLRSRKHVKYTDKMKAFWNFTYHEVGVYDLPAFIDFVLENTGYPKLVYVGLSLGTTFFFVMCSEKPEYQSKIYGSVQLVPIVSVYRIYELKRSVQVAIATVEEMVSMYERMNAMYIRDLPILRINMLSWCKATVYLWMVSVEQALGKGGKFNKDDFCYQLALPLGGSSMATIHHTIQLFRIGKFQQYDYGKKGNMKKYGSIEPPAYSLDRVSVPTAMFGSDVDVFTTPEVRLPFNKDGYEACAKILKVREVTIHFKGPTYECFMKGLSHIGSACDPQMKYYLPDLVDVVDAMTGRSNRTIDGGKCSRRPGL